MLLLIGNAFGSDLSTFINGTVVSLRVKGDRLALWLKKIEDFTLIKTIGMKFKDLLNIPSDIQIIYEVSKIRTQNLEITPCFFPLLSIMNSNLMNIIMKFVLLFE